MQVTPGSGVELARFPPKWSRFDDKKARQDKYAGACSYRQSAYTLPEHALGSANVDFVRKPQSGLEAAADPARLDGHPALEGPRLVLDDHRDIAEFPGRLGRCVIGKGAGAEQSGSHDDGGNQGFHLRNPDRTPVFSIA